jgi:hypothetical protein
VSEDRLAAGSWLAPMVSAAAVAVVVVAGVGLSQLDLDPGRSGLPRPVGPDDGRGVNRASNGRVADVFTCPSTIPYNFGSGESPLQGAALAGPRAFADALGASRFELVGGPEATVLRLGNADGSLASLNTLHERPDGWVLDDMTACDGGDSMLVPTPDAGLLGQHADEPWPIESVAGDQPGAVLLDDREFYNPAGVVGHRSLYAYPCGEDLCLAASDGEGAEGDVLTAGTTPTDLTDVFLPDEPLRDRDPPFVLLGVYDRDEELDRVAWQGPATRGPRRAEAVDGPGWTGRLLVALAPYDAVADEAASVTVHPRDGDPQR